MSRKANATRVVVVLLMTGVVTFVYHGRDVLRYVKMLVNIVSGIDLSP